MKFVKKTQLSTLVFVILLLIFLELSPRSYGYSYSWDLQTYYPFAASKPDQGGIDKL